jgi:hypothetical protein
MGASRRTASSAGVIAVKPLEDWILFDEAGEMLGVSRQGVHHIVFTGSLFDVDKDVRTIGLKGNTFVLRRSAVLRAAKARAK